MTRVATDTTTANAFAAGEEPAADQEPRARDPRLLVALTRDATLSQSLEELTASGLDVNVAGNAEALSIQLLEHPATTVLVDADSLPGPVDVFVDTLSAQFPTLQLLVAGHSVEQNILATRIASGQVCRFVHKPASAQRLKIMVDAANRAAEPQHDGVATAVTLPDVETGIRPRPDFARPAPPAARLGVMAGIAVAVLVLVGALVWWLRAAPVSTPAAATAQAPPTVSTATSAALDEAMRAADRAFAAARYVGSDGTSAAEGYREALRLDPANQRARSGFDRSIDFGLQMAEQALLAAQLDAADTAAATLARLVPGNSRLAFLQSQLDRERDRLRAEAAQKATAEQRQQQIQASLGRMQARLRQGALIEPADDNALAHLEAAERIRADDPAVRDARDALLAALLNAADGELVAGRAPAARTYIDTAASLNASTPGLEPLRRRLDTLVAQPATPAQPVAAAPTAVATAPTAPAVPTPPPAAAAVPTTDAVVQATTLQRLSAQPPEYPAAALRRLVSGWVDLEFTVMPDGSVADIRVVEAQPRNVFDAAAISALRRWRFAPVLRDGVAVSQRAHQRIRFSASNQP